MRTVVLPSHTLVVHCEQHLCDLVGELTLVRCPPTDYPSPAMYNVSLHESHCPQGLNNPALSGDECQDSWVVYCFLHEDESEDFGDPITAENIADKVTPEQFKILSSQVQRIHADRSGYPEVIEYLRNRKLISAIKAYHDINPVNLREAKDAVLVLNKEHGFKPLAHQHSNGEWM